MSIPSDELPDPEFRDSSGKWVVIALFAFGLFGAGMAWTYWKVARSQYLELQKALVKEFPKSTPRVDGGKPQHGGPMTISVVLHVDFLPIRKDPRTTHALLRILELALQHQDLSPYEVFEIYLVHKRPEQTLVRLKATFQTADLKSMTPGKLPTATFEE